MATFELDKKTALVLIDLQNGIVGTPTVPHDALSVVNNAVRLAEAFRVHELPVVLVHVTFGPDGRDIFVPRTDMPSNAAASPPAEDWDQLVKEIGPQEKDIVVAKSSWSAFHATPLDMHLRRRGISELVLAGITTSAGVESTARQAYGLGYHQIFVEDAMSDRTSEAHQHTISRIFPRIGRVKSTEEVLDALEKQ